MAQEISCALRLAVRLGHLTQIGAQLKAAKSSRTAIDVAAAPEKHFKSWCGYPYFS